MWPLLLAVYLLLIPHQIDAQISKPVAHNDNVKADSNKFLERQASDDLLGFPNLDEEALANTQCPRNVELRWQAEVSSSVYATPLIADINGDGKLDIVVPTFVHYLEILEGADGEKLPGWPVYHQSVAHSSPLLYDIDKDGLREILLPTYNGEILIFRSGGFLSSDKLTVPRLRVRKDWYVGLNPDHADRSHPDVHDDLVFHGPVVGNNSAADKSELSTKNGTVMAGASSHNSSTGELVISNQTIVTNKSNENTTSANISAPVVADAADTGITTAAAGMTTASMNETKSMRRLLEQDPGSEQKSEQEGVVGNELSDEYAYDYDDYVDDAMWGDEEFQEAVHEREEDYVNIDAHILSTPVIADIDGDGVDELVVAGSFFYDREYYEDPVHASELNNIDISKYVAGAVVVFNLETKQVKWSVHLDLSTDTVTYRAYIYSSPTVVDLDGDGKLSIIVGTSFGYVYALHHNGTVRKNFPLQMGEIQAQVIAADVNDDGLVEIVTADTRGNIAAWTAQGAELWENHVKSLVAQAPTVGDVNGDGETEIVVPTVSGNIYVLKGKNGQFVPPFPFRTHGRVMSSVLLVDFNKASARPGLTLVCTSFDGYLYLIDGSSGCADAIDIGETSYSMVLADNVDGGDDLDLVVSTMNGNIYCFQTPVRHHPLKAWPMLSHGRNVMSSRYDREGLFVLPASRTFRDEAGESFWVSFKIVDKLGLQGPYNVTVTLLVPGNYQGKRRISQSRLYQQPGMQSMKLPCVPVRTTGTVTVEMVDKHGLYFWDEFSLTFHMRYHRLLKWMILAPMLAMMAGLYLLHSGDDQTALPTFSSRSRHQA